MISTSHSANNRKYRPLFYFFWPNLEVLFEMIIILFLLIFQAFCLKHSSDEKLRRPNVLIILADDLGFHDMPWNNDRIHAPVLNELARNGTILTSAYVMSVCTPSRAALLTSRKVNFKFFALEK